MRQSQLFTRTIKELPKDEMSYNAQTLIRAGFIDKVAAGVYSFLPLGLRVLNKIREIIREEMENAGGQEISMTAFGTKDSWSKTGRFDSLDILFKLNASDQKEYVLNPTHEELVTPLASKFVTSYKDLPFSVFQIQTKFRNEKRAKAGLIRGREFLMKDLYSFHADQADLDIYYDKILGVYESIFNRVGLGELTYLTFASGGSFSKYSHEFQTVTDAGEDLIYTCEKCKMAINKEIIEDQNSCPKCGNKDLNEKKAVEVGNIFKLGTKYSGPFDLSYMDNNGEKKTVVMGCYGIGLSRVLGTIVETCHDEKGIVWPKTVAPYNIHLISLNKNDEAELIYRDLKGDGFEVLFDDRDKAAGEKFADADLIGCPIRLVISQKTLDKQSIEIKHRTASESKIIPLTDLLNNLK